MKLLSIISLSLAIIGVISLLFGIFYSMELAIISLIVIILGLFGWYLFKNLDNGFKEEVK
jgi:hypothetical protein